VAFLPLPPLRRGGDLVPFDGPPLTEKEKAQFRAARAKRDRRNARRRQIYAEKKAATVSNR